MNKIKKWLYERFLPAWCKDDLMGTNKALTARVCELKQENAELRSYISGVEMALRYTRRVSVKNEVTR